MATTKPEGRRKRAASILGSGLTPIDKVRRLVSLGYDEETADSMVAGAQIGPSQMMYYEQLPNPDYDQD